MNLYFPDAWMEQVQRVFENALMFQYTGVGTLHTPGWNSYFWGLKEDLVDEYYYIVGRSRVNAAVEPHQSATRLFRSLQRAPQRSH